MSSDGMLATPRPPAIEVRDVGKRYRAKLSPNVDGRRFDIAPAESAGTGIDLWALRNVSFSVGHGETLGVLGRNGAGKSTLLRILAAISPPSEGEVRLAGRVGALLEVGAGFSADLSGRDNVQLVGTILGMQRETILNRFDDIVDFAGVGAFIDLPVKRYSSGMYLRLAFAVAAHLDAEILLIDEALAVGDQNFRERCLTKLRQLADDGRTVLFVSHDVRSLARLCERAVVLESGQLVFDGDINDAIAVYGNQTDSPPTVVDLVADERRPSIVHADAHRPTDAGNQIGEPLVLRIDVIIPDDVSFERRNKGGDDSEHELEVVVSLIGPDLWPVTGTSTTLRSPRPGRHQLCGAIPTLRLPPGIYRVCATLRDGDQQLQSIENFATIEVLNDGPQVPRSWRYAEDARWHATLYPSERDH